MIDAIKTWFVSLIFWITGEAAPQPGEGTLVSFAGDWAWSPRNILLCVLFLAASLAVVLWLYMKERSSARRPFRMTLATLRLLLIVLGVMMLYGLRLERERTSLPYLAIMLDESASMSTIDDYDDDKLAKKLIQRTQSAGFETASRFDVARSLLLKDEAALLEDLSRKYNVQLYTVASGIHKLPSKLDDLERALRERTPTGKASKQGDGIRDVLDDLRGANPAAIIVLTDALVTEGHKLRDVAGYSLQRGAPLYLIGTGSEKPIRSLQLSDLNVDQVVFVDDFVDLDFALTATGLEGKDVRIVLKDNKTKQVLAETGKKNHAQVTVGPDRQPQRIRLSHRPTQVGTLELVVEVANLTDELKHKVQPLVQRIEVRKARIKVLLVQAYPNFEYRYLKHLLERDPTIDLRTVLQEADIEYAEQDEFALRTFPVRRQAPTDIATDELSRNNEGYLFTYDVVLLGDVNPAYLSPSVMRNLVDFVKVKGGGIVFVAGPQYNPTRYAGTPLASLLPVDLSVPGIAESEEDASDGFAIRPTPLGLTSPQMQLGDSPSETEQIWRNLPEVYWLESIAKLKPAVQVLAEHPTRTGSDGRKLPVFCLQNLPPGKVLFHATDETWRWRYRIGDAIFARYWVQSIRFLSRSSLLSGGEQVKLESFKRRYEPGDPVQLRVTFLDSRLAPPDAVGVTVVVEGDGQQKRRATLDRSQTTREIFEGELTDIPAGNYRAWIVTPTLKDPQPARFEVLAPTGEKTGVPIDMEELKAAASKSRGRFYMADEMDKLVDALPAGRAVRVESKPPIPLWNHWLTLLLFLSVIVGEWLLRKRKGMI